MLTATRASRRPACLPGLLHRACTVLASGLLALAGMADAAGINNTAQLNYTDHGSVMSVTSNTDTIHAVPASSPGVVTFYGLASGLGGADSIAFDGGAYFDGSSYLTPPGPTTSNGGPVSLAAPVSVKPTNVYHAGEPVFITLADINRNTDSAVRETIEVVVTTTSGDREVLQLLETGPDTGVFAIAIKSVEGGATPQQGDGQLSLDTNVRLIVNYQDPYYLTDVSASAALVDPFGFVFDSTTGQPLDGATVTLRVPGGALATVYGDDGVSTFPASVVTGSTVSDSGGTSYTLPTGGFRFPYVQPGSYYFEITPPSGYGTPSSVATGSLPANPATGLPYSVVTGSRGDVFVVIPGPALNIDIPADPLTGGMFMQKSVNRTEASAGDFLQYRLLLKNTAPFSATGIQVVDTLPFGLRYEAGSLRLGGVAVANPAVSSDGRRLTFTIGNLVSGAHADISYVAKVGPGTMVGEAVNSVRASANGGVLSSNTAQVAVKIREALMSGQATLIGRVFEGDCGLSWDKLQGVANVRVMLEDGSYAVTDKDGQYHFKAVKPGTHVVQMDVDSLPNGLEPVACLDNTRFAGRPFSQFVDVRGGALWRADFHTRARRGAIGIRMQSALETTQAARVPDLALEVGQTASNVRNYTLRARFDSCSAALVPEGEADVQGLIGELSGADIQRIELVGNTDSQRMSPRCRQQYKDNRLLSEARARTVGEQLAGALFLRPEQVMVSGAGADNPVASNSSAEGMAKNRRTEIRVVLNKAEAPQQQGNGAVAGRVTSVVGMHHRVVVDGSSPVSGMKVTAVVPEGTSYRRGSARLNGQVAADPVLGDGVLIFPVDDRADRGWQQVIEFDSQALPPLTAPAEALTRRFTLRARFESCSASLHGSGRAAMDKLIDELRRHGRVDRVELVGHVDSTVLSAACLQRFAGHVALSQAQAETAGNLLGAALGLPASRLDARGRGAEEPLADNKTASGRARNRRIEITVRFAEDLAAITAGQQGPVECPDQPWTFKATAGFMSPDNKRTNTPVVENRLACPSPEAAGAVQRIDPGHADSERRSVEVTDFARIRELSPELMARQKARESLPDELVAAGAKTDWVASADAPGVAWLFPAGDYNPRAPASRIAIGHLPGQTVTLRRAGGEAVSGLNFEGLKTSPDHQRAASVWRGVPLQPGRNEFVADVRNSDGSPAAELHRVIHFSGMPVRAELVPEKSILIADGMHRPVVAVRFSDRDGHPVRAGITGALRVAAPYRSWQEVQREQERQLAGMDRNDAQFLVEGDEGIAYIELAPTTDSGNALFEFSFQPEEGGLRRQEVRAWLAPEARDWVVVGFAEGTVGYNTLKDNVQALAGTEEGAYSDGQVSLYAKGRVLGKWLLTMAYDSDKTRERQSLLGVIDPQQFYTLYGDGAEQRHDAASQEKLYLKLERGQFYALFGDYDTGLGQTKLSRYNRTLNGFKAENAGGPVVFTAFAAETPQNFARDEIQGNGTSGLYRLSQASIVLNSEKIRLETRDRLQSEKIVESKFLTRHIDYDIDYAAGTLFFRQPVPSRDTRFNPNFIVAEYETLGTADKARNLGGRVGVNLKQGRVQAGVTAIHEENSLGQSDLAGVDARVRMGQDTEVRVEAAQTQGEVATLNPEGMAWLAEVEHHSGRYDALLYARRQEPEFGLKQQNLSEAGTQKVGADGQLRLAGNWSVLGQVYQQESLMAATQRDAAAMKLQYKNSSGGANIGLQAVNDRANSGVLAGQDFRSEQLTLGANRLFFKQKLELTAQAESAVGGNRESLDYPNRLLLGANYALTDAVRLLAGQEFTDGAAFNTSTTRAGLQATPWKGGRLDSTLNQSDMGEYGPRTYSLLGLSQSFVVNAHWGVDLSLDSSQTLKETSRPVPVVNPSYPVAPGGSLSGPGLTEDFVAVSTGATYRAPVWSWNGRLEDRDGETADRYGLVSNFLRNAEAGVAFSSSTQVFRTEQDSGGSGWLGSVDLAWAWRPLGLQWSLLDRLELRYEDVANGSGLASSGLFGNTSLVAANASSRRIINNLALNRVSREWTAADRSGNLFRRYERNQWSLYYGAKYVQDRYEGVAYDGYIDLMGLEVRHDLTDWLDIGLQASSLNAWEDQAHAYSFGPMVGASPVTNGWITLGWNLRGFRDADFDAARYTAQGPYLQLRFKFDQNARLGFGKSAARGSAGAAE